jgi:hypothetical protein
VAMSHVDPAEGSEANGESSKQAFGIASDESRG